MTQVTAVQRRFFDAAMEILADDGYGGLKLAPLCRRVGVTTGSFYHSFPSWQAFTTTFLSHWFDERTMRIVDETGAVADARGQVDLLLEVGLTLPHASEAAIRVWAGVDPEVRKLQDEVDRLRLETVAQAFEGVMEDHDAALDLARAALYLVVGYEQAQGSRDPRAFESALRMLPVAAERYAESHDRDPTAD